jgi:hypothetical protein
MWNSSHLEDPDHQGRWAIQRTENPEREVAHCGAHITSECDDFTLSWGKDENKTPEPRRIEGRSLTRIGRMMPILSCRTVVCIEVPRQCYDDITGSDVTYGPVGASREAAVR